MLRAYGLLPVDGAKASDYDDDRLWFNNVADERLFDSGGGYGNGTNAGVGYSNGNWTNRGNVNVNIGWRSALPPYARYRSAHGRPGSAGG